MPRLLQEDPPLAPHSRFTVHLGALEMSDMTPVTQAGRVGSRRDVKKGDLSAWLSLPLPRTI
jgi:hypothetical protein